MKEQSCSAAQKKSEWSWCSQSRIEPCAQANVDSYTKKLNDATAALKRAWLDLDRICTPVDLVNKYISIPVHYHQCIQGHLHCNVCHSSFNVVQHTSPQHGVHASSRDHAVFSSCHYQLPDAVCETESLHWHVGHSWNDIPSIAQEAV